MSSSRMEHYGVEPTLMFQAPVIITVGQYKYSCHSRGARATIRTVYSICGATALCRGHLPVLGCAKKGQPHELALASPHPCSEVIVQRAQVLTHGTARKVSEFQRARYYAFCFILFPFRNVRRCPAIAADCGGTSPRRCGPSSDLGPAVRAKHSTAYSLSDACCRRALFFVCRFDRLCRTAVLRLVELEPRI